MVYDENSSTESRQTPYWNKKEAALALANSLKDIRDWEKKRPDYYNPYHEEEGEKIAGTMADAIRYLYDNAPHPDGTVL